MNYVVLDLEWNQPIKGDKIIYNNEICLNCEIIQIGAVLLNDACQVIDTFTAEVKPSLYRSINRNVRMLTGIDDTMLKNAQGLEDVILRFKNWCPEEYVFVTWGYDDIAVLGGNLKYFSLDSSWLKESYNLQMIFCSQTNNENRQYALSYAMQYFNIDADKPLHNALTDAYYTALVCQKLDIKLGISSYKAMVFKDKTIPEHMKNIVYKRNHPIFKNYEKAIKHFGINTPTCCKCGNALEIVYKANNGLFSYLTIGKCAQHGESAIIFKVHKTQEDFFNATEQYFLLDKYNREYFLIMLKKMRSANEKRKKLALKRKRELERNKALVKINSGTQGPRVLQPQ